MVIVFDLDDTLYDEVDFVKSGFLEISRYLGDYKYFDFMWEKFMQHGSGKIFDLLIKEFNLNTSLQKLIEIYRFHFPTIKLSNTVIRVLENIKNKYKTALVTDGHYITQKNKFTALQLEKFIDLPIFTDFYRTNKTETKAFEIIMNKLEDRKYVYIADNPKKDFFAPKHLEWVTIRYKNPNGIYNDIENNANHEVHNFESILSIIDNLK